MKFKMNGVVPPMITPFDQDGHLDEKNLIRLVEFLSPRVDGLFICGSYGSGPLMTLDERKRVAEIVKKTVLPQTAVIVHTGTASTKDTIELTMHAAEIGCSAASAVGPYYYHYSDKDLIEYYSQILKATKDFPFYVYHNPQFSGYQTSIEVMKTLKQLGLSGIKDATFDIMIHARYMRELADETFDIALGTEAMWVPAYALGSKAFIPGIGNVFPELCSKMWHESMDGKLEESRNTQFLINALRDIMYLARSTQLAIYAIAEIKGIVKAFPRAPFIPATREEKLKIAAALENLGV